MAKGRRWFHRTINLRPPAVVGAETNATSFPGAIGGICRNPLAYGKLVSKIRTTVEASCEVTLSTPEAPGNTPYLGTVIREHPRIFVPSLDGTTRVVPLKRAEIYIDFIPGARMAPWPFA